MLETEAGHPRCHECGQPIGQRNTDWLTGLLDRWGWNEVAPSAFGQARQHGASTALVVVDLDHFKEVNDRFGHLAGDAVLQHVALALRRSTRMGDLLGRYGGDELVVLLPATTLSDAVLIAHRIQSTVKMMRVDAPVLGGSTAIVGCTVSIGVAADTADRPVELFDLFLAADAALQRAKIAGRDQVWAVGLPPPVAHRTSPPRRPAYDGSPA
ncbi:MAG TPA: GGDEF domain-containing protein [Planosporangium sp.]|jgi:diguanylate cyclase (GGDEF)-like protein|nr:GGDEF domain-containing protein [Planosporangium sp.]